MKTEHKCDKCGGRLALISGTFEHDPDPEPYESGVEEKALCESDTVWIHAFKCDDCDHIQGFSLQ